MGAPVLVPEAVAVVAPKRLSATLPPSASVQFAVYGLEGAGKLIV